MQLLQFSDERAWWRLQAWCLGKSTKPSHRPCTFALLPQQRTTSSAGLTIDLPKRSASANAYEDALHTSRQSDIQTPQHRDEHRTRAVVVPVVKQGHQGAGKEGGHPGPQDRCRPSPICSAPPSLPGSGGVSCPRVRSPLALLCA